MWIVFSHSFVRTVQCGQGKKDSDTPARHIEQVSAKLKTRPTPNQLYLLRFGAKLIKYINISFLLRETYICTIHLVLFYYSISIMCLCGICCLYFDSPYIQHNS